LGGGNSAEGEVGTGAKKTVPKKDEEVREAAAVKGGIVRK
jgi:hypothetical protein